MPEILLATLAALAVLIIVFGLAAWRLERTRQRLENLRRRNLDESSDTWSSVERVKQTLTSSRPKKRRHDG